MKPMNERIRILRKTLGLTQQEFADKLGISRGNIGAYEVGKSSPSDAGIALICREFGVREEWLRGGEGEMLAERTRSEQIAEFADGVQSLGDGDFKKRFVAMLSALGEEEWEVLERMALALAGGEDGEPEPGPTIDEKVEAYRRELLREKEAGGGSGASWRRA